MISFRPFHWWFTRFTGAPALSATEIPFFPGAMDVFTGAEVVVTQGSVVDGVRASCGFPGVFSPMRSGGRRLVDGGIANNVPVSMVWDAGADFVIASNIIPAFPQGNAPRLARGFVDTIRGQTLFRIDDLIRAMFLMMSQSGRDRAGLADHVFDLDAQGFYVSDFGKADQIRDIGLQQARQELPDMLAAWEQRED
jgi:predicted acylesterase/phospholipase RssA